MLDFTLNQSARIPVRLFNSTTGLPASGVSSGSVQVSIQKADGTASNVTIDGTVNIWTETTIGSFAGQGKYDLVLGATNTDTLGILTVSVFGGGSVHGMALIQVVNVPLISSPVVGNFVPPPGTIITGSTAISFTVTDANAVLKRVIIAVSYASTQQPELAFDGTVFRGDYAASSSRASITNGFSFNLLRRSNWPSSPTIEVYPIDVAGNE